MAALVERGDAVSDRVHSLIVTALVERGEAVNDRVHSLIVTALVERGEAVNDRAYKGLQSPELRSPLADSAGHS